jgi:hypothetical protein
MGWKWAQLRLPLASDRRRSQSYYPNLMTLISFGYDQNPEIYARGLARADWSLAAYEDSRGLGWQIVDPRHLGRSQHMSQQAAEAILLDVDQYHVMP